jgi:surfeit locus 1 family protein
MNRIAWRSPGPVPTIAAVALVALTIALGNWQTRRAGEKIDLAHEFERRSSEPALKVDGADVAPDTIRFRRVTVRGEYEAGRTLFIDNRVRGGVAGYEVVTPLRLAASDRRVLVDRGWVAGGIRRDVLPTIATPAGLQTVEGIAVLPPERVFELKDDAPGSRVRQHLLPGRLAAEWKISLYPFVLEQAPDAAPDGLERTLSRPVTGAERNRAYALQWYSFAALTVFLYVFFGFKRARRTAGGGR